MSTPDLDRPRNADAKEAVKRLCTPMRDAETGRFAHKGTRLQIGDGALEPILGIPFCQELYVRSQPDDKERMMNRLLGVMQKGPDDMKLLMHYYQVKAPDELHRRIEAGDLKLRADDVGELMYTMTLQYDPRDDSYRGNQRYPVKLHHLVGMMPEDVVKKMFSKDKKDLQGQAPAVPPGMPMPGGEWHILELHPSHVMYMHAFLFNLDDEKPMPMMGMQTPYKFAYSQPGA